MHWWAVVTAAATIVWAVWAVWAVVRPVMTTGAVVVRATAPIHVSGRAFYDQRRAAIIGRATITVAIAVTAGGIGGIRIAVVHTIRRGHNAAGEQGSACYGASQGA